MSGRRFAVVTGAARGIGHGIARHLASNSYEVIAIDKDPIKESKNIIPIRIDLSNQNEISHFIQRCEDEFQEIEVLVNNAAVSLGKSFLETNWDIWSKTVAVNQAAPFFLSQGLAKLMIRKGTKGRIVNVASVNSYVAEAGHASYVTSKGAIAMMTKAMAIDLAPHDIRVNAVAPGPIMHEATEKLFTGIEYASAIKKGVPMGRAGLPSEVAELISFLISDHSSYITGQVVVIDGGYTSYARLK